MDNPVFDDADFERAEKTGEAERRLSPDPTSVHFDAASERIVLSFRNGAVFMVPAHLLQGLEEATTEQLSDVVLLGRTGLHFDRLHVDYTITGLMNGIFGTAAFTEGQRRGGRSRSDAKIAASSENGAKGGRPRKVRP